MKQFLDFISIDPITMVIAVLNILILCVIFKKFLFNRVEAVIQQRKEEVADIYQEANSSLKQSEELKEMYDSKLGNIQLEREEIIKEAKEEATIKAEAILNESKSSSIRIKNETDKELTLKRSKMYKEMKEEVADISVSIAEKIIEREIDEDKHKDIVEQFIEGLELKDE